MYDFGFGLTGTSFEYGPVQLTPADKDHPATAATTLTNTGTRPGEEVAQLYIHQKACPEGARPAQELRGFRHVALKPGESASVTFELNDKTLGYFNRSGKFVTDAGQYQVWIAPHANLGKAVAFDRNP